MTQIFEIVLIKNHIKGDGVIIEAGRAAVARLVTKFPDPYPSAQILYGRHAGEIIPYLNYSKLREMPTNADYDKLAKDNKRLENELKQAEGVHYSLQDKIEQLRPKANAFDLLAGKLRSYAGERPLLPVLEYMIAELTELQEQCKPVEVPKDVARALDYLIKIQGEDFPSIVYDYSSGDPDYYKALPYAKVITDYAADNFSDFIRIPANGYTAAEEPSLRDRILNIIDSSEDPTDAAENLLVLIREERKANEAS